MSGIGGTAARPSARAVLAALMTSVGVTGLTAAARDAGLLALVDQHVAAVRESLSRTADQPVPDWLEQLRQEPPPVSAAALAGYAEGVRDAALEYGWQPPPGPVDWSDADWVLVRLVAVCALAREAGIVR
ncbi:MAG TPA: DUF6401 family natural product biosynthesis protein [Micromonosporaceae bacterium]